MIIGTALGGILAMKDGLFNGLLGGGKPTPGCEGIPHGELYNERKEQADYVELTKQFYEGQIATQKEIDGRFFDLYKLSLSIPPILYYEIKTRLFHLIHHLHRF